MTDLVYSGLWEYIKSRVLGVQRVKLSMLRLLLALRKDSDKVLISVYSDNLIFTTSTSGSFVSSKCVNEFSWLKVLLLIHACVLSGIVQAHGSSLQNTKKNREKKRKHFMYSEKC